MVRASGDGGAAAHLHGPDALFANPTTDVVPTTTDVVATPADVVPAATTATNVVPLPTTSTAKKGRNR